MFSLASCGVNHFAAVHFVVDMQRLCGSDESRKVAHQRVGRLKKLSTVEPEVLYFQPGFFPDFPHHGVFFCLTAVHISSHQNIRGLAVPHSKQCF